MGDSGDRARAGSVLAETYGCKTRNSAYRDGPRVVGWEIQMEIHFKFNLEKSVEAIAYLIHRMGPIDKVALVKLLYVADRNHFIRCGYPITGSRLVAMDKGPLPSECLKLINGEMGNPEAFSKHLASQGNSVRVLVVPKFEHLEKSEKRTLDLAVDAFGSASTWDLVEYTHKFPEWIEVYIRGTSKPITFEKILEHWGGENKFHHGRPVLSRETQARMVSPFTVGADSDL